MQRLGDLRSGHGHDDDDMHGGRVQRARGRVHRPATGPAQLPPDQEPSAAASLHPAESQPNASDSDLPLFGSERGGRFLHDDDDG
jgi:hypothetical protein